MPSRTKSQTCLAYSSMSLPAVAIAHGIATIRSPLYPRSDVESWIHKPPWNLWSAEARRAYLVEAAIKGCTNNAFMLGQRKWSHAIQKSSQLSLKSVENPLLPTARGLADNPHVTNMFGTIIWMSFLYFKIFKGSNRCSQLRPSSAVIPLSFRLSDAVFSATGNYYAQSTHISSQSLSSTQATSNDVC